MQNRVKAFILKTCSSTKPSTRTFTSHVQVYSRRSGTNIYLSAFSLANGEKVWVDPSQAEMWRFGGCVPKTDPSYGQGFVKGWLTLYDSIDPEKEDLWAYGGPRDAVGVKISESSFDCEGDYCKITCSPFEVVSLRTYEFVGTLRVGEDSELILENIDVDQSSQLVDGKWAPIQKGNFDVFFP